jgi:hypothetical protein
MFQNENAFKKVLSYSYTDSDIRKYLGEDAKIIEYEELLRYNTIFDLLPQDKSYVIILIETKDNYGHYVCLCRLGSGATDGRLQYVDSYGKGVDMQQKFIDPWWRRESNQDKKHLSRMIKDCPYKLEYMSRQLQSKYKYDATCGRYMILFILQFLKGMDIKDVLGWFDFVIESQDLEKYKEFKYDLVVIEQIPYTGNNN